MDTAAIIFVTEELPLPHEELPLAPEGQYLRVGCDVGWLGFPAVSPGDLCFFSGCISAWIEDERTYLVDGVAINGVSGGPTFAVSRGEIQLSGVVSAYIPNRAVGEALPGLSMVRDVTQCQEVVKRFRSLEEAEEEASEQPPQPPGADDGAVDTRR